MKAILALDQGTTSSRAIVFDRAGVPVSVAQQEFRQIFPQPGWVEHDPEEIFATQRDVAARALARGGALAPRTWRPSASPTSARPRCCGTAATGRALANAIVWQDRRTASRCDALRQAGHEAGVPRPDRARARRLLLRDQARLAAGHVPGARARAERGELAFGTIDSLARLAADRRRRPRHRREQRLAHPALQHPRPGLGRRAPRHPRHPPLPAAARRGRGRGRRRHALRRPPRRHPDRRPGGRPAGRPLRPGLPPGGARQEHLRHRLLPADEHGRAARGLAQPPAHHGGVAARRGRALRPRGQRVHRGRGRAVAARRPGDHREVGGRGAARGERAGRRRRLLRAGAGRPGLAALGPARARHHRGPHARLHGRAPRPRHPRGDRLPERRAARAR